MSSVQNSDINNINLKKDMVKGSFYFTYVFLITTGTITFIEALRTHNPKIRHIMNLETCISIVAAVFYGMFVEKIKDVEASEKDIPYAEINLLRYTDWFISTPLMLLVLCLVLSMEKKKPLTIYVYFIVLVMDIAMLALGYMGELKLLEKRIALVLSFLAFFLLYGFIWMTFMSTGKNTFGATLSYYVFLVFWSIYGVVYMADEETKNIAFNVLDLIAKAFVGIFFWLYFTGAVKF
jgi:bacteriorhodopsin